MIDGFTEVRVREITVRGEWPWRFVVEGLTTARMKKRWPWSRSADIPVEPAWVQLPHGVRGYRACTWSDAATLAEHYEDQP